MLRRVELLGCVKAYSPQSSAGKTGAAIYSDMIVATVDIAGLGILRDRLSGRVAGDDVCIIKV